MPKFVERVGSGDLPFSEYYNDINWVAGRGYAKLGSSYQCTDWGFERTQEIAETRCTYFTSEPYYETRDICSKPMFRRSGKGNACEWFDDTLWDKTTKASEVRLGDIVIYGKDWGKGAGHLRIVERIEGNYMYLSGANENYQGGVKFGIKQIIAEGGGSGARGLIGYIHNPFITYEEPIVEDYKGIYFKLLEKYEKIKSIVNEV